MGQVSGIDVALILAYDLTITIISPCVYCVCNVMQYVFDDISYFSVGIFVP